MYQTICNLTGICQAKWLFWLFFWSTHWYSGLCMSYYSYVRNEREPESKPISLSFIASLYFHPSLSLRGGTSWSLDGKIKQATPSFVFPSALGVCVCAWSFLSLAPTLLSAKISQSLFPLVCFAVSFIDQCNRKASEREKREEERGVIRHGMRKI